MTIDIQTENLADKGRPPVKLVTAKSSNGAQIELFPSQSDEDLAAKTVITAAPGKDISALLRVGNARDGFHRLHGVRSGNAAVFKIDESADLSRLARQWGMAAGALNVLSYNLSGDKVSSLTVGFADHVSEEQRKEANAALVGACLREKIVDADAGFALGEEGHIQIGDVQAVIAGKSELKALEFSPLQNVTGQAFSLKPHHDETTRLVVGRDLEQDGRVMRLVSDEELRAAEKLAKLAGGRVIGETGLTSMGVMVQFDQTLPEVAVALARAKAINASLASFKKEVGPTRGQMPRRQVNPALTR